MQDTWIAVIIGWIATGIYIYNVFKSYDKEDKDKK